jgi:hypothetical protein
MAHGFSAVKEMYLDKFAEVFAAVGLGALVFDNRNLAQAAVSRAKKSTRGSRSVITAMPSRSSRRFQRPTRTGSASGDRAIAAAMCWSSVRSRVCEQAHEQLKGELGLDHFEG